MSTIDPGTSQRVAARLAEKGIRFIDAPVSGGVGGATAGSLAIMVGGAQETFEACEPLLRTMGAAITHMGELGAGQVTKACNQIVIAATLSGIADQALFLTDLLAFFEMKPSVYSSSCRRSSSR